MGGIRRRKNKKPKKDEWNQDRRGKRGAGYAEIVKENAQFEAFYKAQGFCESDEEFSQMMEHFRAPLPASFRVTGFRSQAVAIRNLIETKYMKDLANVPEDGDNPKVEPKCLEWYPERMAWQLNLTRKNIRREEAYFRLHNFLISETESGNISRQETVSMIPPLVLDVQPHHKVLDMCAAPGSKTAQLIEALHANEDTIPEGLVIANDSDNTRCYLLVHQAKRLQSPNVIITNHDASNMPNIHVTTKEGSKKVMKFDRILCDVPCSGDGTLRKNADIWPKWNPGNSCSLHGLQYRIAKRGLEMLDVGGRLVYSTCSIHPVEDEAVIKRLLEDSEGAVELVDVTDKLPGLKFKPGMKKWILGTKDDQYYKSWDEVTDQHKSLLRPTMFPAEEDKFNLERCKRILPHQQDTGGFFIAVLHKKSNLPWEKNRDDENKLQVCLDFPLPSNDQSQVCDDSEETEMDSGKRKKNWKGESKVKKGRYQGFREDPFLYLKEGTPFLEEVFDYFAIKDLNKSMFFIRCKDIEAQVQRPNHVYFSSLLARNILETNGDRIKIINTGVKAFSRCENKGAPIMLRLAQEGSLMTIPFVKSKIIRPTLKDLELLLMRNDTDNPLALQDVEHSTQLQLDQVETGSIALIYEGDNPDGFDLKLELVGWKGKGSVRAYVPKNERIHYLRLIGADTSKFEKNKFQERREQEGTNPEDDQSIAKSEDTENGSEDGKKANGNKDLGSLNETSNGEADKA